ncbi:MAG: DNA-binding protein [Desulfohalobiaceae bacterium]
MKPRICYIGAKEICRAIGENPKRIVELVEEHGLPAQKGRSGTWRALLSDLEQWVRSQHKEQVND